MAQEDEVHMSPWNATQPRKSEIMPFAATEMDLEIITLSEGSVSERHKSHAITYVESKIGHKQTYL